MSEWDEQEPNQYTDEFAGVTIPVNVSILVLTGKKTISFLLRRTTCR